MYNQNYYQTQNNSVLKCTPFIIYLVLLLLKLMSNYSSSTEKTTESTVANTESTDTPKTLSTSSIIYNLVLGIIIYMLCKNGYNKVAWFFLLLPIIALFTVLFAVVSVAKSTENTE